MLDRFIKAYNEAVFETDKEAAFTAVNTALAEGIRPEDIVFKIVIPAVEEMMHNITKDPDANLAQHFMTCLSLIHIFFNSRALRKLFNCAVPPGTMA